MGAIANLPTLTSRPVWDTPHKIIGILSGLIGIACCIYPITLALLGLSSAAAAVGLGNRLYSEWGWVFKIAGAVFFVSAISIQRRRAASCEVPKRRNIAILKTILLGISTYGAVYFLTKALAIVAT